MSGLPSNKIQGSNKVFKTTLAFNNAIKNICDIMRRSNCTSALQYIPELTWILFLRILDDREHYHAKIMGNLSISSLTFPYRWQDWAAPNGSKRIELQMSEKGSFFAFVNNQLIPYLKNLKNQLNATPRHKIISEIMSSVVRVNIKIGRAHV